MPPVEPPFSLSLCRLAPPTCPVGLGHGHEGDHHCGAQFTDCVRMVHFERSVLSHVPTSSTVEVAQDPKASFKVSRQKTALAPAQEEVVELYGKRSPGVVAVLLTRIDNALSYPGSHARLRTTNMLEGVCLSRQRGGRMWWGFSPTR
jgi:hypothetical protein